MPRRLNTDRRTCSLGRQLARSQMSGATIFSSKGRAAGDRALADDAARVRVDRDVEAAAAVLPDALFQQARAEPALVHHALRLAANQGWRRVGGRRSEEGSLL